MIPYFARRRRFFYSPDSLPLLHPATSHNISKGIPCRGTQQRFPLHLIIYLPTMTSPALIAAGKVSLFHNGERNNGSPLCVLCWSHGLNGTIMEFLIEIHLSRCILQEVPDGPVPLNRRSRLLTE